MAQREAGVPVSRVCALSRGAGPAGLRAWAPSGPLCLSEVPGWEASLGLVTGPDPFLGHPIAEGAFSLVKKGCGELAGGCRAWWGAGSSRQKGAGELESRLGWGRSERGCRLLALARAAGLAGACPAQMAAVHPPLWPGWAGFPCPPGPQSAEGPWAEWEWLRSSKEVPAARASRGPPVPSAPPKRGVRVSGDQRSQGSRDEGAPRDCGKGPAAASGPGRAAACLFTPQALAPSSVACDVGAAHPDPTPPRGTWDSGCGNGSVTRGTAPSTCRWLCLLGTLPAPRSRSAAAAPRWHRPSVREVSCSARGRTSSAARRASECHPIGPMGKLRRRE